MTSASFTLTEKQMALLKRLEPAHFAYFLKYKHSRNRADAGQKRPPFSGKHCRDGAWADRSCDPRRTWRDFQTPGSFLCLIGATHHVERCAGSVLGRHFGQSGVLLPFHRPGDGAQSMRLEVLLPELRKWFNEEKPAPPRIDVELSTLDTALFMLGVLSVRNYFRRNTKAEKEVRALATRSTEESSGTSFSLTEIFCARAGNQSLLRPRSRDFWMAFTRASQRRFCFTSWPSARRLTAFQQNLGWLNSLT